jgi:hypothetical protein
MLGLSMTEERLDLLLLMLQHKGIINENEVNWLSKVNSFNEKIIFSKLHNPEISPSFHKMMSENTYQQFEDHCRTIAAQDAAEKQKANNEE